MKEKLYHRVPDNMKGDVLVPASSLQHLDQEIYDKAVGKYSGRETWLDDFIPSLNSTWRDVINLSPVHPKHIRKALIEAGRSDSPEMGFYEIDPIALSKDNTVIYVPKPGVTKPGPEDYIKYNPEDIIKYSDLPEETKRHYREMVNKGKNPFLFQNVPHILHKGEIDVSRSKIVKI